MKTALSSQTDILNSPRVDSGEGLALVLWWSGHEFKQKHFWENLKPAYLSYHVVPTYKIKKVKVKERDSFSKSRLALSFRASSFRKGFLPPAKREEDNQKDGKRIPFKSPRGGHPYKKAEMDIPHPPSPCGMGHI